MPDLATFFGALIGVIVAVLILSAILRWLWNSTMPDVFGLKAIGYWQALKLILIAGILFGSPAVIDFGTDGGSAAVDQTGSD